MTKILYGKPIIDMINKNTKDYVDKNRKMGEEISLAIVRTGNNSDDISYENNIKRNCDKLGINYLNITREDNISTKEYLQIVDNINKNNKIKGAILLSLFERKDADIIKRNLNHKKDIDCMTDINLSNIFMGDLNGFTPCVSRAVFEILDYYEINIENKDILIINRSINIGKTIAMIALSKNATVTIAHSRTKNLKRKTKQADIIITGIGEPEFFDKSYFTKESIIIDVGVGINKKGNLSGDVSFHDVNGFVKMLTPVPKGVGSVTTSILLNHLTYY